MRCFLYSIFVVFVFTSPALAQGLKLPAMSPKCSITQTSGLTEITINYSRPGVRGREIWGGLVPYEKVWRTGANAATTISISTDAVIQGQKLAAGTYSIHTIPGKYEWTVIFNTVADQWGSYAYDSAKDALRIKVKPQTGPHVEWMTFSFPDIQWSLATIELSWEKLRIPFKLEFDTHTRAMENIKTAMESLQDWTIPYDAADYAFESNTNKEQAMEWIEHSISLKETYWNPRLKAAILARDGKTAEAITTAENAVRIGKENKDEPGEIAKTEKLIAEWKAEAPK